MPRWISINDFKEYLNIIKHGIESNSIFTYNKLLLLSDFFENNEFVEKLVKENIVPNFDYSNVIDYLENSYLKLSSSKENSLPVNISWFELFMKAIEFVSKNFIFYLNTENSEYFDKLAGLNKKILEELLDKSIEQIISNPFIFDDEIHEKDNSENIAYGNLYENNFRLIHYEIFEKLIDFLHKLRNTNNIFDLLMNEYLRISSDETINEISSLPNPTLSIDIPVDVNNYYKEFTLDLNIHNRMVVFIVYYKQSDDSLNVSFKLTNIEENPAENPSSYPKKGENNNNNKNNFNKMKNPATGYNNSNSRNTNNKNDTSTKITNNNNIKTLHTTNTASYAQNLYNSNNYNSTCNSKDLNLNKFSTFKILTFLNIVTINDDKNKTQINTNIIPNNYNKSAYPIYKINNFTKYVDDLICLQNEDIYKRSASPKNKNKKIEGNHRYQSTLANFSTIETINLKINLKLCNIHSAITSFILKYFNRFYLDDSIFKISKQFFLLLIKNRSSKNHNEDHIVIALLNWCKKFSNILFSITA